MSVFLLFHILSQCKCEETRLHRNVFCTHVFILVYAYKIFLDCLLKVIDVEVNECKRLTYRLATGYFSFLSHVVLTKPK